MSRVVLPLALLVSALIPATATARTVAIDQQNHNVLDTVVVTSFIDKPAPRGWHYVVAISTTNEGKEIGGEQVECDSFRARHDYDRRRQAFTFRLRPSVRGWCAGTARAYLLIQRNTSSKIKVRGASLRLRFSE